MSTKNKEEFVNVTKFKIEDHRLVSYIDQVPKEVWFEVFAKYFIKK